MSDSSVDAHADLVSFFKKQAKIEKDSLDVEQSVLDKRIDRARKKFYEAQKAAKDSADFNVSRPEIANPPGGIETIKLSTNATSDDLTTFFEEVDRRYLLISSLVIEVTQGDRKVSVPVTPRNNPDPDKHTYHVNEMECPGKGFAEILVRESDNYIVAFRVYATIAERANTRWCVFNQEIPKSFGEVHKTRYKAEHDDIEKFEFGAGILEKIFDFLYSLQQNPRMPTSVDGQKYVTGLFVLFGEAQRFRKFRDWAVNNVSSNPWVRPTKAMSIFMQGWSSLCKVGFALRVALLELALYMAYEQAYMDEGVPYLETENPYRSLPRAKEAIRNKELKHADVGLRVRSEFTNKIELDCLVGGELLLLNHDEKECEKILMREAKYRGLWFYESTREDEDEDDEL